MGIKSTNLEDKFLFLVFLWEKARPKKQFSDLLLKHDFSVGTQLFKLNHLFPCFCDFSPKQHMFFALLWKTVTLCLSLMLVSVVYSVLYLV